MQRYARIVAFSCILLIAIAIVFVIIMGILELLPAQYLDKATIQISVDTFVILALLFWMVGHSMPKLLKKLFSRPFTDQGVYLVIMLRMCIFFTVAIMGVAILAIGGSLLWVFVELFLGISALFLYWPNTKNWDKTQNELTK
ncbi:hypothetical protein ABFB50_05875 [Dehalococcoides sp. THU3]|uniref:hypothetical protein n=1 Tax=Dehalococcoides TaxID=61434 RepID=UPI0005B575F5|nr:MULTISPECIES: hypothetical protein [Dehalococcoides]QYY58709.1 hypothetical protein CWV2_000671 [Dehalococcoides mccartyi]BAQ35392.1 putative membrane protein [Dehalococcoides sp. UCH007]